MISAQSSYVVRESSLMMSDFRVGGGPKMTPKNRTWEGGKNDQKNQIVWDKKSAPSSMLED